MSNADRRKANALGQQELESLRKSLLAEKHRMIEMYHNDVHAAREIREEGVEDYEELASMDFDRDLLYSMSESELDKLLQIDEALERMTKGTFGRCMYSGEPIPLERLREVPWTRYAADVQTLVEQGLIDENLFAVN
jgi:DnaK suppressor protein